MSEDLRQRFAALPDEYEFAYEDGPMVAAVAGHGTVVYGTSGNAFFIKAFDKPIVYVGDLRAALRDNPPPPPGEDPLGKTLTPFSELLSNMRREIAVSRMRTDALLRVLVDAGIFDRQKYAVKLQEVLNLSYWRTFDGLGSFAEEKGKIFSEIYAEALAVEAKAEQEQDPATKIAFPDPPAGRDRLYDTTE